MTTFGPYEFEVSLGRGGMGQVHRAYDTRRDRVVAVKVLLADLADDAAFRARFARECRSVARLREPHIIPIHDFGEIDGRLFLDMRLVDGQDLGTLLADGPLSLPESVDVVGQIASALDAAHRAGLVHRDVKPGNVLLSDTGTDQRVGFAYLVDFGIARSDVRTSSGHSTAGLVGTVAYMAPERIAGDADDARADVYSLACVLYECLAGRPPFEGDTYQVLYRQVNTPPPRLDVATAGAVPAALADVLERGLAKDPADRFPTAGALATAARLAVAAQVSVESTGPAATGTGDGSPPPAAALRDRYRFVRDLGRGGMGTVWLARDEHLSRLVAVKRMLPEAVSDPESVRRIMREAELAARLHHPHSVMVLDRIVADGVPHVVMEYVRGRTLAAVVTERGSLDVTTTAEFGLQIAAALAEAHRLGITHRDVKPANVLVTAEGVAKLADFGVARVTDDPGSTASGRMTGTIAYMAPEVAAGETGSPASDMWSLGATLYTCTEGHAPLSPPGRPATATAMLLRLVNEPVPAPVRAGALTPLLLELLDVDPARRPSPARTRRALAELAGVHPLPGVDPADPWPAPAPEVDATDGSAPVTELDLPRSVPPSGAGSSAHPRGARPRRRRRWVAVAVAAVLATGGATVVAVAAGGGDTPASPGRTASNVPAIAAASSPTKCATGANGKKLPGCGLPSADAALARRIPSRFGVRACETVPTRTGGAAFTAGVTCGVTDPAAPVEHVQAVAFASAADLTAYLTARPFNLDLSGLPAGACGPQSRASMPWASAGGAGQLACNTSEQVQALAWTYPTDNVLLIALTTPTHTTVTIAQMMGWFRAGSVALN